MLTLLDNSSSSPAPDIDLLDLGDSSDFDLPSYHLPPGLHLRHNLSDPLRHLAIVGARPHFFNMDFGPDQFLVAQGTTERALVLILFVPLILFGLVGSFVISQGNGNSWMIYSVARVLCHHWFPINLLFRQISVYILILSIVDLSVVLSTPMLISYTLTGTWKFGSIGCKLFFTVENVNKLLSVMILASISVERFIAVCRPLQWLGIRFSQKRMNSAFTLLAVLFTTVAVLCAPIIYFAQANHYMLIFPDEGVELEDATCGSQLPDRLLSFFTCYMFLFGFVVPLPLVATCYFFIIRHIRHKPHGTISAYTTRAIRSILRVVIFHFICWTPFWLFVILPLLIHFQFIHLELMLDSRISRLCRMLTCFLPYLNCSLNWIFYGMMNRQLRETGGAISGRRTCMPLSTLPRTRTISSSVGSKRSMRSLLIGSSRV